MLAATATLPVRRAGQDVAIIDMPGDVTDATESPLLDALRQASKDNARVIILNLSGLQFLNSSGLGILMELTARVNRQRKVLLAFGLSDHYQRVFALTRLSEAIRVYPVEDDALAAARVVGGTMPAPVGLATTGAETSSVTWRDAANWALPVARLTAPSVPRGGVNLNVDGRRLLSPLHGFGRLWRKTYSIRLSGSPVTPAGAAAVWKRDFGTFWPGGNYCFGGPAGIAPGEVQVLNLTLMPGMKLYTGVMVIYADETSFCFLTPEGHMFGGLITFRAIDDGGTTVLQVQPLIRASDPLYELTLRLGVGGTMEDRFWRQTLKTLAATFGVQAEASLEATLIDPGIDWSRAKNIRYNAAIRTTFYRLAAPLRWLQRRGAR